jgi:phospholipid-binding lipoprotein MlaA
LLLISDQRKVISALPTDGETASASLQGLRTVSYCAENEESPIMKTDHLITTLLLLCAVLLAGCATMSPVDQSRQADPNVDPIDPYEHINRKFYKITDTLDRHILEPVANVYLEYVPNPLRRSIGNFYDNVGYPNVVLNAFLQGKVRQGFEDTLRFAVNSTIGLFGLFDMATPMGLLQHDEDFGQTLGVWGLNTGAYLYLPFHGPSSSRDISSIPVGMVTNALFYVSSAAIFAPIGILGIIDKRARFSDAMIIRDQVALDPYLFVREASLQQRRHLIYDGNPPPESYDDSLQDDSLEDASVQDSALQNNSAGDRRADKSRSLQGDPARDGRMGGFLSLPREGDGHKAGTGSASDDLSRTSSGRDPAIKTP